MTDTLVLNAGADELPAGGITPPVKRCRSAEPPVCLGVR